jgi:Domain of Unknown Function with PDB structure (DUF3861)
MNSYRYKITVETLTGAKGDPVEGRILSFEAANHDDILGIVERMQARLPFDEVTVASLGGGVEAFLRGYVDAAERSDVRDDPACAERIYERVEAEIGRRAACEPWQIIVNPRSGE